MEKEQKKLLLVAVSVGVFLLVTITASIILLTPKVQTQSDSFFSSVPVPFQPGRIQDTEASVNESLQSVNNRSNETSIVINGVSESPVVNKNSEDKLTIQIPKPAAAAVPDTPETQVSKTASASSVKPQTTTAAAVPKAAAAKTGTALSSTQAASTRQPTAATARTNAPVQRTINDYWIQTGAYSSMVRAEDVKERLSSNGFTSIIENREVNGRILYRVRLGPYTSEKEANYWLSLLVKSIDDFGDSQVRQTTRQQL